MWFIGVEIEQETSAPPPKNNPGSATASCDVFETFSALTLSRIFPCYFSKKAKDESKHSENWHPLQRNEQEICPPFWKSPMYEVTSHWQWFTLELAFYRSKLSLTARIITKYSLERFLSIWGEKMSEGFLKFFKLISNLILVQIVVSKSHKRE